MRRYTFLDGICTGGFMPKSKLQASMIVAGSNNQPKRPIFMVQNATHEIRVEAVPTAATAK